MSRIILAIPAIVGLAFASSLAGTTAAKAADPVCLSGTEMGGIQCSFETLAQCQATLSGMSGTCTASGTGAVMTVKMPANGLPFNHTFRMKK